MRPLFSPALIGAGFLVFTTVPRCRDYTMIFTVPAEMANWDGTV
jgi:hypothetical protein